MVQVVVLGAGLGGMPMAIELRERLAPTDRVTVISDREAFQFTPSNPWVAVNWHKPTEIQVPLAPVFARKGIEFVPLAARHLDPGQNRIELADGRDIAYDYLAIATGPELAFDEVPGLGPGGYTHSVCTLSHTARTAAAWEEFCRNPGPLIVGSAPGVSCFGPDYEFAAIADTELRRRKIRDRVPMTFVTCEPYIGHLGIGGIDDSREMLESELRERRIEWITNAKTTRVESDRLHVTEVDDEGRDRKAHELPFRFAMLMPAFRGIKVLAAVDGLVDSRGFVLVDRKQRNARYPNVFAIGMCIAIPPAEATPVPTGVPKTGFMIESMVGAAARNISALAMGKEPVAEAVWDAVCLADLCQTSLMGTRAIGCHCDPRGSKLVPAYARVIKTASSRSLSSGRV
jgi:sulfide:quinone oxidoreductase